MVKFFINPFAVDGDKTAVPDATQVDGSVSYEQGFGFDYERDPVSDPDAKNIPRDETNQLYYDITNAIRQYQTHGIPDFITTSDNDGVAFPYDIFSQVRYDDGSGIAVYTSLVDANVALPSDATKWRKGSGGITQLTGAVTAAGEGSVVATLSDNAVTTSKIAANAVDFSKIQTVAAHSVLVNPTASSGQIDIVQLVNQTLLGFGDVTTGTFGAITIGPGLQLLGNVLSAVINQSQLCKAWVNFSVASGVVTIRKSYNVTGVTRTSAGFFNITLTNAAPDALYGVLATSVGNAPNAGSGDSTDFTAITLDGSKTTNGFTVYNISGNNESFFFDPLGMMVAIYY